MGAGGGVGVGVTVPLGLLLCSFESFHNKKLQKNSTAKYTPERSENICPHKHFYTQCSQQCYL